MLYFQQAEILEKNEEEMQELRSRIEFERAEYESEIEQLQDELRNKDDNVKVWRIYHIQTNKRTDRQTVSLFIRLAE